MIHTIEVENIKCGGCMNSIKTALLKIENVNMNSNFSEIVIVSQSEISVEKLQKIVSYDEKYKITKIK